MRLLVAFMLVAVALSGCADPAPANAQEEPEKFQDVEVADDKGVIRGVIIDTEIRPVADATIAIKNLGLETQSDEDGLFLFTDLEPGAYFLDVQKVGYGKVQSSTQVQAGVDKPEMLRIQVELNPSELPSAQTLYYEAFISCGFKTLNFVWDAGSCDPTGAAGMRDRDNSMGVFDAGRPDAPSHFQSEVFWKANQPLSSGLVTIQCNRDNAGCTSGTGSDRICNIRGESPLICRVNNNVASEDIGGGGNNFTTINDGNGWNQQFAIGLFSNCGVQCVPGTVWGVGVAIDQEVAFYVTLFYNHIPEEDWEFIDEGEYEF